MPVGSELNEGLGRSETFFIITLAGCFYLVKKPAGFELSEGLGWAGVSKKP